MQPPTATKIVLVILFLTNLAVSRPAPLLITIVPPSTSGRRVMSCLLELVTNQTVHRRRGLRSEIFSSIWPLVEMAAHKSGN